MDWNPALAGLEGWWEETYVPGRWCAGLTSRIPASAQPVFGATFVLGGDRPVTMSLVFPEHYPRFSSNPVRSLSPECIECFLEGTEEEEERDLDGEGDGEDGLEALDRELLRDYPDIGHLLPKYYQNNFSSMFRTR